jgi:hypothetical protein
VLNKLNKISSLQASIIITIAGLIFYFDGLKNQFLGDDNAQIVTSLPVHSIANIKLFFEGGTFYTGNGLAPLQGSYFRPLMTTAFSLVYTIFGAHPIYFHLLQLLLCIGSTVFLYLFFRYSFRPVIALFLSLVFLVHPLDSQVVFAIANLQDALFFFFGILGLWLLIRFSSLRSLWLVAVCILLSLLSKETGILFVAISLIYLFWWNKERLYWFCGITVLPITLWLLMKTYAVGFFGSDPGNAPIDRLSLVGRLMTAPSILQFYITKFIFPWKLASAYYWEYPTYNFRHFLLPFFIDAIAIALVVYVALAIRKHASRARYLTYVFFAIWCALGVFVTLQIIPLDFTASEAWFYFPMVGVLGMMGMAISVFAPSLHVDQRIILGLMIAILLVLGVRTIVRGTNWTNWTALSYHDITASKEDYNADYVIASNLENQGKSAMALSYVQRSISIFPDGINYGSLGFAYNQLGNYVQSDHAYIDALTYSNNLANEKLYEANLQSLTLFHGNPAANIALLKKAVLKLPNNGSVWFDLAVLEYNNGDPVDAKKAILKAYSYNLSSLATSVYSAIINNQPVTLTN